MAMHDRGMALAVQDIGTHGSGSATALPGQARAGERKAAAMHERHLGKRQLGSGT